MADSTKTYYEAIFTTSYAKTLRLKIDKTKPKIPVATAKTALADIIAADVLNPEFGSLTGAKSLSYVTVSRTPYNI